MNPMNEQLLGAWLRLSTSIVNSRVVPDMTYNESLVCNILYNQQRLGGEPLTATRLCAMTGMLKSQMNRTLNALENRSLVQRQRSEQDKRQVFVSLDPENCAEYIAQHNKILHAVDVMIDKIGEERAQQAIDLFTLVSDNAGLIMSANDERKFE